MCLFISDGSFNLPSRAPRHCGGSPPYDRSVSDKAYDYSRNRNNAARKFRNSIRWIKCRKLFAKHNPLCCDPFDYHKSNGKFIPMTDVHHIVPLSENIKLGLVWSNLAPLCKECHHKIEEMERKGYKTSHFFLKRGGGD